MLDIVMTESPGNQIVALPVSEVVVVHGAPIKQPGIIPGSM